MIGQHIKKFDLEDLNSRLKNIFISIEAILIFLRNTSFGPELNLNLTDPATNKQFKTTVTLDQLPIIKNLDPDADGTFTTKLPKTGICLLVLNWLKARRFLISAVIRCS